MPRRRYRHVPSAMVGTAASRGYVVTRRAYSEMTADYHNECWKGRQPSIIIIQPRRYCDVVVRRWEHPTGMTATRILEAEAA